MGALGWLVVGWVAGALSMAGWFSRQIRKQEQRERDLEATRNRRWNEWLNQR